MVLPVARIEERRRSGNGGGDGGAGRRRTRGKRGKCSVNFGNDDFGFWGIELVRE